MSRHSSNLTQVVKKRKKQFKISMDVLFIRIAELILRKPPVEGFENIFDKDGKQVETEIKM